MTRTAAIAAGIAGTLVMTACGGGQGVSRSGLKR